MKCPLSAPHREVWYRKAELKPILSCHLPGNQVTHLSRAHLYLAISHYIIGAIALLEHLINRTLNCLRFPIQTEGAQQAAECSISEPTVKASREPEPPSGVARDVRPPLGGDGVAERESASGTQRVTSGGNSV